MMKMISEILNRKDGKRARGFTLIELLVVVVIIGILAAIAVPIYLNQRKAAWNSSVESDVKNASTVVETVANDNAGSTKGLAVSADSATGNASLDANKNYVLTKSGFVGQDVPAVAGTDDGKGGTTGGSAEAIKNGTEVTVSDGNTLVFKFGDSYTITGTNKSTGKYYQYDSSTGAISGPLDSDPNAPAPAPGK